MTTTMLHPDTTWTPTTWTPTTWTPTTWTPTTDVLRSLLDDALDIAGDDAGVDHSSRTPAGRTLLDLAALARRAAGALGADPGVVLTAGPGVVVQRELAAATRLLAGAAAAADGESQDVAELLAPAQQLYAQLLGSVAGMRG
jgi:hypothetical protein